MEISSTLILRGCTKEPLVYLLSDSPSALLRADYYNADTKHELFSHIVCIQSVLLSRRGREGLILLSFTPYLPAIYLCITNIVEKIKQEMKPRY